MRGPAGAVSLLLAVMLEYWRGFEVSWSDWLDVGCWSTIS